MAYPQMMLGALLICPAPRRVLVIGLGGAHLPRQAARFCPEARIDAVEVDAEVIRLARRYFLFETGEACRAFETDGRVFIKKAAGGEPYDIVWLDAFKSGSVPFHLKTREFYEEIRDILTPGGVAASNLYGQSNRLKPHDWATFRKVFRHAYGFEDREKIATVLLATNREPEMTAQDFLSTARKVMKAHPGPVSLEEIAARYSPEMFSKAMGFVFKDDFTEAQFQKEVLKNNLDGGATRPYPILNFHEDE